MSKKGYRIMVCCLLLMVSGLLYSTINAYSVDPGTIDDPLVTKSYVDEKLEEILNKAGKNDNNVKNDETELDYEQIYLELNKYIDGKLQEVSNVNDINKYQVVEVETGQKLICSDSTEVILRSGTAKIIGNNSGDGISDITIGVDLSDGVTAPKNHLLIIPRDDGRGLDAETKCFVMVKGVHDVISDDTENNDD